MKLFFDTETTGLPRSFGAPASDVNNWPRMIQIAWVETDNDGKEIQSYEAIIKPEGFSIPIEASNVHGITTDKALEIGTDLGGVLSLLHKMITETDELIAHNISFDEKVVGAEFLRNGFTDATRTKSKICTMHGSTEFCKLPGRRGYKWPKLQELHVKLFNEEFEGAHDALADVRACVRSYFELQRLGVMA